MMSGNSTSKNGGKCQGRGRSNSLPSTVVDYLKAWLMSSDHINHPYPTEQEKAKMVADTGIELKRLNNWFVNNRIRYWKPRMEALQRQQHRKELPIKTALHGFAPQSIQEDPSVDEAATPDWFEQIAMVLPEVRSQPNSPSIQTLIPCSPGSAHAVSDASSANESTSSIDDGNLSDGSSIRSRDDETVLHHNKSSASTNISAASMKRRRLRQQEVVQSPRTKYSRKNADIWRLACMPSPMITDKTLPTLDEAARLFGFAQDQ
jgi:hypothetical protein